MSSVIGESGRVEPVVANVAALPTVVFGKRDLMWWGTGSFMVIEGYTLALIIASYFYLMRNFGSWPPEGTPPPTVLPFAINMALKLVACVPFYLASKAAQKLDQRRVAIMLTIGSILAFFSLVVRAFEFGALNVRWDENAYGSALWTVIGFHTTLVVPDFIDGVAIAVIAWKKPMQGKHFVGVTDNAYYWYFCTISWIITSAILLITPRVL